MPLIHQVLLALFIYGGQRYYAEVSIAFDRTCTRSLKCYKPTEKTNYLKVSNLGWQISHSPITLLAHYIVVELENSVGEQLSKSNTGMMSG